MKNELILAASFFVLTALMIYLIYKGLKVGVQNNINLKKFAIRFSVGITLWAVIVAIASITGFTSNFQIFPFNMAPIMGTPLVALFFLVKSKNLKEILIKIPVHWLLYIQGFRIIVEILLWKLFLNNLLPVHLTFEGMNMDVFAGIIGIIIGYVSFIKKSLSKYLVLSYNILGLALLINIVTLAILTFPTPFQVYYTLPDNSIFLEFPFNFLPGILVPMAYYFHAFSIKKALLSH